MADDDATEEVTEKKSRKVPLIMGGIGLLVAVAGFSSGYVLGMNSALVAALHASDEQSAADENGAQEGTATSEAAVGKAVFLTLRPDFTANFNDGENMRFMQVGLDVMARDEAVLEQIEELMPKVRYEILKILGGQDAAVYSPEGKDALLAQIRSKLQQLVVTEAGTVEDVFYTSFLIQ